MRILACFVIGHHKVFIDCVLVAMLNVIDLVLGPSTIVAKEELETSSEDSIQNGV